MESYVYEDILTVLVAMLSGFLIGMERTREQKKQGARDHIMIAMTAAFSVLLYNQLSEPLNLILMVIINVTIIIFILLTSIYRMFRQDYAGYTTTLALIAAYIMGLISTYSYEISLTMSTIILILLASKKQFHKIRKLSGVEWTSTVEFLAISMIVLILIPPDLKLGGIRLKSIFFVFLSILSIKYFSYFLLKGNKGNSIYYVSLLGGLAHSEATTVELSELDAPVPTIWLVIQTMLLRIILVVLIAEDLMKIVLIPLILTATIGIYFSYRSLKKDTKEYNVVRIRNPLSFKSATIFSLTYFVAVVINAILNLFDIPPWLYLLSSFLIGILSGGSAALFTAAAFISGKVSLIVAINMFLLGLSACIFNKVGYVAKFKKTKEKGYLIRLTFFLFSTVFMLAAFTYISLYIFT